MHKSTRQARLTNGIYGIIKQPILNKGNITFNELPTYYQSHTTSYRVGARMFKNSDIPINQLLDLRCFYTGIVCSPASIDLSKVNHSATAMPWLGTKDHLVPARRGVKNCPIDLGKFNDSKVWCSNVINVTLGLVPLPIRLKIRQWLMTAQYDKNDTSIEAGENMRWILINMIQDFRINDRLVWSRKADDNWWYPEISTPLMDKWWKMELEFLSLDHDRRNDWVENFVYHF